MPMFVLSNKQNENMNTTPQVQQNAIDAFPENTIIISKEHGICFVKSIFACGTIGLLTIENKRICRFINEINEGKTH